MQFQFIQPSGFLRHHVKHYCFMESDVNDRDTVERVIPTDSIQLMFHYRNPFVTHYPNGFLMVQPKSIISGLSNAYSDVSTAGSAGVVFVTFYPAGAGNFFRFPLSDIANKSIDLSDIFHHEIQRVEEKLFLLQSLKEKVQVIEEFLRERFSPIPHYDYLMLQKGIETISHSKGQTTANALAEKLSTTPKNLERKFSRYMGKTTKQVIKLIRFNEVIAGLHTSISTNLTQQAYMNGYFDQSHFIKDFKTFTGYTPKEYLLKHGSTHGVS